MRRILSLLMALVMAAGVCLCISSCKEAGDTSSTDIESNDPSCVSYDISETTSKESIGNSHGHSVVMGTALAAAWNDMIYNLKGQSVQAFLLGEHRLGLAENSFIRAKTDVDEVAEILKGIEAHIVKEITREEVIKIDEDRKLMSPYGVAVNLAEITVYDYSPYTSGELVFQGDGKHIEICINEKYIAIHDLKHIDWNKLAEYANPLEYESAYLELDGSDITDLIERIKDIKER